MSHFLTLVITKTNDRAELESALQPFHEFECTGIKDQHVVEIDKTEEALADFAKATETRLKDAAGILYDRFTPAGDWDPRFSEPDPEASGWDKDRKREFIPPGFTKVEVPASEVESAAEWIKGQHGWGIAGKDSAEDLKYGWIEVGADGSVVRCVDVSNPEKRWDWWVVGGRYSGRLFMHGRSSSYDQAKKGDLDLARMAAKKASDRLEGVMDSYSKVRAVLPDGGCSDERITELWAEYMGIVNSERIKWEAANTGKRFYDWLEQIERVKELRRLNVNDIGEDFGAGVPDHELDPIAWANSAPAITALSFLGTDGVWHEKGEMGWWGMIHNEKEDNDWDAEFQKALAAVPDDHWINVVDCHI